MLSYTPDYRDESDVAATAAALCKLVPEWECFVRSPTSGLLYKTNEVLAP